MQQHPLPTHDTDNADSRLRRLIHRIDGIAWEADPDTFILSYVSPAAERILGYPTDAWYVEGFWQDHIHSDDRDRIVALSIECTKAGRDHEFEYRMIAADGRAVWFKDCVTVTVKEGVAVALSGIMMDVSDLKRAQREMEEQANFSRQLCDSMPNPIFWKDADGRYLGCNTAFEDYVGLPRDYLIGKTVFDIAHKDFAEIYAAADNELFQTGGKQVYDAAVRCHDGTRRHVTFSKAVFHKSDGTCGGLVGVMLDISEQKKLADALQAQHDLLQSVLDNVPCGIALTDDHLNVLLLNDEARAILGTTGHLQQPDHLDAQTDLPDQYAGQGYDLEPTTPAADGRVIERRTARVPAGGFVNIYLDVTEERAIRAALVRESTYLKAVLQHMPQGISVFDEKLRLRHWNACMAEVVDLPPEALYEGAHYKDLTRIPAQRGEYGPGDAEQYVARFESIARQFQPHEFERVRPTGKSHLVSGRPMWVAGKCVGFVTTYTDITEHKRVESQLQLSDTVFNHTTMGIAVTDANRKIVRVNPAFCTITGYAEHEVIGKSHAVLSSGRQDAAFYAAMWRQIEETGFWCGEIWNRKKSGELYAEHLSIKRVLDRHGLVANYIGIFTDISPYKIAEDRIQQLSFFDVLTGLPNRSLLRDRLQHAMHAAQRHGTQVALLLIDIDRLSHLNDSLGHHIGDLLLVRAKERWQPLIRATDTLSRHIGDEFAVLVEDLSDVQNAADMAERFLSALAEPFMLDGHEVSTSACIGISIFPSDGGSVDCLLKHADVALHHAKSAGTGRFQFFRAEMNHVAMERLLIESSLRQALIRNEFQVFYQPQVDLASGVVRGMEALARWRHPELGLVSPARFIPIAEETGQIIEIGLWVMREACRQTYAWNKFRDDGLVVAVNVSARQFNHEQFAEQVKQVLKETGLPPHQLELEITESVIMDRTDHVVQVMKDLRKLGVRFSIDDFGTGYSSLSQLKRFPIDTLKIDQSFTRDIGADEGGTAITCAVIALGHSMRLKVVAEGVETEEQQRFLIEQGCHGMQGFLFSKPIEAAAFAALLGIRTTDEAAPEWHI